MYYAQLSWYIRTTARRTELQHENERTNWYPENVKHGRFGDWLANMWTGLYLVAVIGAPRYHCGVAKTTTSLV